MRSRRYIMNIQGPGKISESVKLSANYRKQFHDEVKQVRGSFDQSKNSFRNTISACTNYQEEVNKTLEDLFKSIVNERETSKSLFLVEQQEKSFAPLQARIFDIKKIGVATPLVLLQPAVSQSQIAQIPTNSSTSSALVSVSSAPRIASMHANAKSSAANIRTSNVSQSKKTVMSSTANSATASTRATHAHSPTLTVNSPDASSAPTVTHVSDSDEKLTDALTAMSNALDESLAYQSQFASKYAHYLNGPLQIKGKSAGQQLAAMYCNVVSKFSDYDAKFLDELDTVLADPSKRPTLGFVHDHRAYRQDTSEMSQLLSKIFIDTIDQFEMIGKGLEDELKKLKETQNKFCDRAFRQMRSKVQLQKDQLPEVTRIYISLIKTAGEARWAGFETCTQIYAAIQKGYLKCLFESLKNMFAIKVGQRNTYVSALALKISEELNRQAQSANAEDAVLTDCLSKLTTWDTNRSHELNDASFKGFIVSELSTMRAFIK